MRIVNFCCGVLLCCTCLSASDMNKAFICQSNEQNTQFLQVDTRVFSREVLGEAVSYEPLGIVGYQSQNISYTLVTGLDLFSKQKDDTISAFWAMGFSYIKTSDALFLVEGSSLRAVKKDVESNGKEASFPAFDKDFSLVGRLKTATEPVDITIQFKNNELIWLGSQHLKPIFRRHNVVYARHESTKHSILFWYDKENLYLSFGQGQQFSTCAVPKEGEVSDIIMSPPMVGENEIEEMAEELEEKPSVLSSEDVKKSSEDIK